MAIDSKINNIIGSKLPQWLLYQLETRANQNSLDNRVVDGTNDNIIYLGNKSAWVRVISSVDIDKLEDLNYFKNTVGATANAETDSSGNIKDPSSLAKEYILYGGTSKYLNKNSYQIRSGLGSNNAYGMLGEQEINQFGYKPMPGINSITIETQGRLGSLRAATINFKCWDKNQLDIIDALYFKLGYTMFIEWGNTFFYPSKNIIDQKLDPNKIQSTEFYAVDPFEQNLTKEQILSKIAKSTRETEGNYDAMLGICTNFNFTYTQDGGYDCTLRIIALGILGDSIKINNSGALPLLLAEEIEVYNNTLARIEKAKRDAEILAAKVQETQDANNKASDINNYLDCLKNLGTFEDLSLAKWKSIYPNGRGNNKPPYKYAYYAKINNIERFFYVDKTYQTTGLTGSGTYDCVNGVLYIDGKSILATSITNQTPDDYLKTAIDNENKRSGRSFLYYWFPSDENGSSPEFKNSNIATRFPIAGDQVGYYIRKINAVLPLIETLAPNAIKVKIDYAKFNNKFTDFVDGYWDGTLFSGIERSVSYTANKRDYEIEVSINSDSLIPVNKILSLQITNDSGNAIPGEFEDSKSQNQTETKKIRQAVLDYLSKNDVLLNLDSVEPPSGILISDEQPIEITLSGTAIVLLDREAKLKPYRVNGNNGPQKLLQNNIPYQVPFKLTFNDTYIIEGITSTADIAQPPGFTPYTVPVTAASTTTTTTAPPAPPASSQQNTQQTSDPLQTKQSITSQSSLELVLNSIQLHTLNKAIRASGNRLDIGMKPFKIEFITEDKKFLNQIFSVGIMSNFIDKIITDSIDITNYNTNITEQERLEINSYYGFATNLMAGGSINNFTPNNFKETFYSIALPYEISQEVTKGTNVNRPVYIPLGFLLMILNNVCTIYDTKDNFQTPLVYVDFNNNHNFFLSTPKQISTDCFNVLIPYEGTAEDFKSLFDVDVLSDKGIKPPSGSNEYMGLFEPSKDVVSKLIPPIKYAQIDNSAYRGKIMNILLSIDYLVQLVKDYSYKDGSNNVYLKPFLEQILSKINKSIGDFNALRLSYNDQGNCFQIVDDQFIPSNKEDQIFTDTKSKQPDNRTELPLFGKKSIAKSLEIRTDISSKLGNMIAISSNSTVENKSTLSTNGDSIGYLNTNFRDRYIKDKLEITGSASGQNSKDYDTLKIAARHFNKTILDFYNTGTPSSANVSDATNYYIEKLTKVKNADYATRAAAPIPVSLNFSTDGISGLSMGNAFTIPQELLPYTYATKKAPGMPLNQTDNVGFIVTGLTHTIENNSWNTTIRANMYYLKDRTSFNYTASKPDSNIANFTGPGYDGGGDNNVDSNTACGCKRCPPGAYAKAWNEKKQKFERQYSCADQVDAPESVNSSNFGSGRKYYGSYTFVKGTSDINLSKAGLSALTEAEIVDDTTQNKFLIGTITTNPDERVFVVHHTAGNPGAASRVYSTFYGRGLPAQYVIDKDGKIHRFMPDGARGWHAGNYNSKSIGVEISANNNEVVSQAQVNAAVRLIHYLGFKKSQVVGHGEISDYKQETEGKKVVDLIRTL